MARRANAGELRTRIRVMERQRRVNADGIPAVEPVLVLDTRCKWVNAHGSEVYEARQAGVTEPATLTMRYTGKITTTSEIYRDSDPTPYEVISINDVENRHTWLEVRVQRKAASK